MAKLDDKKKRQARKAIEFGIRYGCERTGPPATLASNRLGAHYLFHNAEHREVMALIAHHWKDPEAKIEPADVASCDEREMVLLAYARGLYVYRIEGELIELTTEGKEALARYIADESGSLE